MNPIKVDPANMSAGEIDDLMRQLHEQRIIRIIEEMTPLRARYQSVMTDISAAVEGFGLTAQKYLSMTRPQLERHMMTVIQNQAAASLPGGKKIVKVPPKYRNPEDPDLVWTGRGNKPIWVREWLAAGHTMDEVLIKRPAKE